MFKVFLNDPIADGARARLAAHVELVDNYDHPEELDAIIVRQQYCTREVISRAKKCRLIQQHGTGLDRIDVAAAKEYGIPVCNTPGANAQSVAEYALMMMLALSRKAVQVDRKTRAGLIPRFGMPEYVGRELQGRKLGLIGSGHVAQALAAMTKNGFGMQVYCSSARRTPAEIEALGFLPVDSPAELFETCDYVSLHNTLTPQTWHMVNAELLAHSNPGLILINTARGGLIDEPALYSALKARQLLAAGLDVFEQQPPAVDNPLFTLDNFMAGMHVGGSTTEALERNGKAVVDNVFRALGIEG